MQFTDFIIFAAAAEAIYPSDPNGQRNCRACLCRLLETAKQHPGEFLAEAAKRDVWRGVAFRQKSLDDPETDVFAQRLADRLQTKPTGGNYGNFLRNSVRSQGDVLGDMQWDTWEIAKKALELGGVDPNDLNDPQKSPAERLALLNQVDWGRITLPALKAKLGPAFKIPADWKRQFAIETLKRIKAAVEQGQPITDPHERKLLGIWRTVEVQLGGEGDEPSQILPAGPKNDVGMTRLPMKPSDRKRFYNALTGSQNEGVDPGRTLQLSPQAAHD